MPRVAADACPLTTIKPRDAGGSILPGLQVPKPLSRVRPIYPGGAALTAKQGVSIFEVEVTEHGTVGNGRPLNSDQVSADFEAAAARAVSLWRFEPGMLDNCRVPVFFTIQVSFRMQ